MRTIVIGLGLFVFGCGPSYGGQGVKTPDELVAEQEALAEEQERERQAAGPVGSDTETDMEKRAKFDTKQADLELKRAARSGATCPGVVTEPGPSGKAAVRLVFGNDGRVKEATIAAPFTETPIGECVLNAMKSVIVPRFTGPEETIEWEIDVEAKAEPEPEPKKKKK